PGFNFRMPTICAALGLSQFNKMQKVIEIRRSHGHYLSSELSKIDAITVPKEIENHFQVYQMYTIQLKDKETRDKLQQHLVDNGIMNKVYFEPVHLKTLYKKDYNYKEGDLPKTEALSNSVLNLPLYPDMTKEDLDYMIKTIKKFFENE
ncbi:MAG: DegT/DnrJ/EryC1/StrS family aminotransferase, partial [Candidatus Nanoarchaeia archaeon]|nr:DegT/DnrJ/EryC1/StrS family aminotransferase [Candidatus Nanoarchaeia archaeon]